MSTHGRFLSGRFAGLAFSMAIVVVSSAAGFAQSEADPDRSRQQRRGRVQGAKHHQQTGQLHPQ